MGTWNAFYIKRVNGDESLLKTVQAEFPEAKLESNENWIAAALDDEEFVAPEEKLQQLSGSLHTEVIWMSFQSAVDAFQFHHWRDGKALRNLVYGCFEEERTWERVEGSPEPWEQSVFFSKRKLDFELKLCDDDEGKRKLQALWSDHEFKKADTLPSLEARECAWEIGEYYQLPHYARG